MPSNNRSPSMDGVNSQFDAVFGARPAVRGKLPCDECTDCPHRLAKIAADERASVVAEGQMDLPIPGVEETP